MQSISLVHSLHCSVRVSGLPKKLPSLLAESRGEADTRVRFMWCDNGGRL